MRKAILLLVFAVVLAAASISYAGALTAFGTVAADVTAIATDNTYHWLGTANGKVYKQTISSKAISATLAGSVPAHITGLCVDNTTVATKLYVTTSAGKLYVIASP